MHGSHCPELLSFFQQPTLLHALGRLQQAGFQAEVVGGAVRDALLGNTPHDFDIVTNANVDEVCALFPRHEKVGAAFGIVLVIEEGCHFEVAQYREEGGYEDGRHPSWVRAGDRDSDARRRDFTVNALYYDPLRALLFDPTGQGRIDLHQKILRAIGDPATRFKEDWLRPLRLFRFISQLGFAADSGTLKAAEAHLAKIHQVSRERFWQEWEKLSKGSHLEYLLLSHAELLLQLWADRWKQSDSGVEEFVSSWASGVISMTRQAQAVAMLPEAWRALALLVLLGPQDPHPRQKWWHWIEGQLLRREQKKQWQTLESLLQYRDQAQEDELLILLARKPELLPVARWLCSSLANLWSSIQVWGSQWPPRPLISAQDLLQSGVQPGPGLKKHLSRAYLLQLRHPEWTREMLMKSLI